MAGSAVWISFLAAGVITILTGYSFVQMGIRYPSRGGIVEYLVQAYGPGLFSGACSVLFYIAQVIGMTMIALAFGKYSVRLLGATEHVDIMQKVFGSGLIVLLGCGSPEDRRRALGCQGTGACRWAWQGRWCQTRRFPG